MVMDGDRKARPMGSRGAKQGGGGGCEVSAVFEVLKQRTDSSCRLPPSHLVERVEENLLSEKCSTKTNMVGQPAAKKQKTGGAARPPPPDVPGELHGRVDLARLLALL